MTSQYPLIDLMERLQYQFRHLHLLECALSHRSVGPENNERLEFLGDAVLSLVISNELYDRHPNATEGELSRLRSLLVNGEILAHFSQELQIGPYLRLGVGERKSGGQGRQSILADALEAIIGAIYLDGGFEPCRNCLLCWYGVRFDNLAEIIPLKDAKSRLQEWLQRQKFPLPDYQMLASGKAHEQKFVVTCRVQGLPHVTQGQSTNRRKAEQEAAHRYLELVL